MMRRTCVLSLWRFSAFNVPLKRQVRDYQGERQTKQCVGRHPRASASTQTSQLQKAPLATVAAHQSH